MKHQAIRISALMIAAAFAQSAFASGYHFGTQSISAQGTANSNAAEAGDATVLFYNPAGMSYLQGDQFSGVLAIVNPNVSFTDKGSYTAGGVPTKGGNGGDIVKPTAVPHLYYTHKMDDALSVGVAAFVPYGDAISYDENWAGRYNIIETKLESFNINPSFALKVNDRLRIGGGISAQYMTGTLVKGSDFGSGVASLVAPMLPGMQADVLAGRIPAAAFQALVGEVKTMQGNPKYDGSVTVKGDDWGFGWNVGLMFDIDESNRFSLAYRSQIRQKLTGDAKWTLPSSLAAMPLVGTTVSNLLKTKGYVAGGASISIVTPESLSMSFLHRVDKDLALTASLTRTDHSRLQNLTIKLDSGLPQSNTVENWRNTWAGAIGATYRQSEQLTLRAGMSQDQSPVQDQFRTPSLPDGDRKTFAFGGNYALNKGNNIDFVASYTTMGTLPIKQFDNGGITDANGTPVCNQALNLSSCATMVGEYKITAWTFGIQYNYKF
ncbi:OmpP1/FadL family transporter [Burkholderiaceae bacterium DAT-1]|nr:OmpP1/FadL family transporter [Burkholderiaceae bacterium DAT-1]